MTLCLPAQPHIPGQTPRPDDAVFDGVKATLSGCETPEDYEQNPAFRAGFTCFERGYYWEAHECWEAVWMRLPPASREKHVVQALIQLANARLKQRMGKPAACARILKRADAAWKAGFGASQDAILGVTPQDWYRFAPKYAL